MSNISASWTSRHPANHLVQFYENEDFLYSTVGRFLADGLMGNEPAVVIATEEHRKGFADALAERGWDAKHINFFDARETLSAFMCGPVIDEAACKEALGSILTKSANGHSPRRVRAYGEMVDLLWREGNGEAALRLEELWNDLGNMYDFSLLCAYPIGNFYKESHTAQFEEICQTHTDVIPAETFDPTGDVETQRARIAVLQQRAAALEAEIAHRKELEDALRRREAEHAFLLEASSVLNRSLDSRSGLTDMVNLVVPRFAEWCAVDLASEDGAQERIAEKGIRRDAAQIIPIHHNQRILGTITLGVSESDLPLARELARRAAVAIENSRLYQLAQDANRIKDEFLATLSHELRTPLTAILGWARMLTIGGLDAATVRTAVETIEHSARTQAALIDDLLDLSKVVTGKLSLRSEPVDVSGVINGAVKTLQLAADARSIHIEVSGAGRPAIVAGDSTRLQQIVWNLLSNALKFSDAGGTVSIALSRADGRARIVVTDKGRGIAPDFLPHVFEPFRQADGANTRAHGGLGLGLAIVKYLTELHGGIVTASSNGEGHGATFTVTLPLVLRQA